MHFCMLQCRAVNTQKLFADLCVLSLCAVLCCMSCRCCQPPRVSHVGFGLVLGEDGKKFKTRSGDVVRLVELLDEAKARCYDNIKTRRQEVSTHVAPCWHTRLWLVSSLWQALQATSAAGIVSGRL